MENQLAIIENAPELGVIEKSKADKIKATFEPMVKMLKEFESAYESVITESEKEITKEVTQKAKRLRIDIGRVRIETDKIRVAEKEEYLRAGKAIDGVSNILKWAVTEKENKLKEIENHFEILEQKRLEELQKERAEMLMTYIDDAHERNLSGMEADVWNAYFAAKKKEYEDRIEAEKKAEAERVAKEKAEKEEQERIRKENERLRIEAEKKEKELAAERAKAEAEAKAAAEKAAKERAASEAILRAEQEKARLEAEKAAKEKAALEAELRAKAEAEAKAEQERKDIEEVKRKEAEKLAKAPIKAQLTKWCDEFIAPQTSVNHEVKTNILAKFEAFKVWAKSEIEKL
jgi:colicin import membrane protein